LNLTQKTFNYFSHVYHAQFSVRTLGRSPRLHDVSMQSN